MNPEEIQWQPMSTAPKDGTAVIIFSDRARGRFVTLAHYESEEGHGLQWWDSNNGELVLASGWLPMPANSDTIWQTA